MQKYLDVFHFQSLCPSLKWHMPFQKYFFCIITQMAHKKSFYLASFVFFILYSAISPLICLAQYTLKEFQYNGQTLFFTIDSYIHFEIQELNFLNMTSKVTLRS